MHHLAVMSTMAFLDGLGFDPFFRGLLSVLTAVVVLMGSVYLIIATNTGTRHGMLIALSGLFGWMFLMGIAWTVYGIGWKGQAPTWDLVEIDTNAPSNNNDALAFSQLGDLTPLASGLPEGGVGSLPYDQQAILAGLATQKDKDDAAAKLAGTSTVSSVTDPDLAQSAALQASKNLTLGKWRYLPTSSPDRGEAQASVDTYLVGQKIFATGGYVPEQFGAFIHDGKPVLKDNPNVIDRITHTLDETILHPFFGSEYIVVQARASLNQPTLPGQPPPVAKVDPAAPLVSVVMERNRGGPVPALFSGLRFTPAMFAIFNGLIFAILAFNLHVRDKREADIRAAAS